MLSAIYTISTYILDTLYDYLDIYTPFRVKLLHFYSKEPTKAESGSAGYDLYSIEEIIVPSKTRRLVSTGISIEFPKRLYARIAPRSGLSVKNNIDIGAGVIDSSYRGEVKVLFINNGDKDYLINIGDKIAQLILEHCANPKIEVVDELSLSERGESGFGSTGK
jgi:dUTP pyrophosphatase